MATIEHSTLFDHQQQSSNPATPATGYSRFFAKNDLRWYSKDDAGTVKLFAWNPMTAVGDLVIGGTAGVETRLAAGSNGKYLKMVSGSPAWADAYADPLTTKGDIAVYGSATTRQGVGADGTVLLADSAQANGLRWGFGGLKYLGGLSVTTTQAAFAHGLGYTPTVVLITFSSSKTAAQTQAADGTNIYLTGSGSTTVYVWVA